MRFEWDPEKNRSNRRKHGLSFEDASGLFASDEALLEIFDSEHSNHEDRFIAVGRIELGVIVVVFTEPGEDVVRILSARKATKAEQELFESYSRGGHGGRNA
jgi:uncharacterized DUF497 family protein